SSGSSAASCAASLSFSNDDPGCAITPTLTLPLEGRVWEGVSRREAGGQDFGISSQRHGGHGGRRCYRSHMPGFIPGIRVLKAWMAGSSPGHDEARTTTEKRRARRTRISSPCSLRLRGENPLTLPSPPTSR